MEKNHQKSNTFSFYTILLVEVVSIIFYAVFLEYSREGNILLPDGNTGSIYRFYECFQDVHVMIFIGFGFLMTFLKKFWFSSLGLNFWIGALGIQYSILTDGFFDRLLENEWHQKIQIKTESLIFGDFAAASLLISFGALLGKVNFNQITLLSLLQLVFYSLNQSIAMKHLKITDIGGSMIIHTFGAFFGLTTSKILTNYKTLNKSLDVQGSNYTSDLFSMIGTIYLFMYWPSFNGALAIDAAARERCVANTILSICNSCLFAFIFSRIVNPEEKFDMIHIQNSTLAGGVAIGAVADLPIQPFAAMIIGMVAGIVSVMGYKYLQSKIEKTFGIHDTCGVNNLHGMPGFIGGVCSAIAAAVSDKETYGDNLIHFFPKIANGERTSIEQGGYQILCLFVTIGIAILGGIFSGKLVKFLVINKSNYFQDIFYWEGAEGYIPTKKGMTENEEREFEKKIEVEAFKGRHHKGTLVFHPEQLPQFFKQISNMDPDNFNNDPFIAGLPEKERKEAIKQFKEFASKANTLLSPEKIEDKPLILNENAFNYGPEKEKEKKFKKMEISTHKKSESVDSPYRKIKSKEEEN